MSDDLRARIAAAAANAHYSDAWNNADRDDRKYWMTVADAVIAALNLNTQVKYLSVDGERRNIMVAGHYTVEVDE